MADVDVLIPHFNDPDGLMLSVDSIRQQDFTGTFRIVVVDDGSLPENVDSVKAILSNCGLDYELIECRTNRGRPFVRNILLMHIRSRYVTWLDAGDEWYPAKTRLQVEKAEELESSTGNRHFWITCNYDWQQRNEPRRICTQETDDDNIRNLLVGQNLRAYLWTLLAPAEAFLNVGRFDERLPRLQDLDFFIRFALQSGTFAKPDEDQPLCVYHKSFTGRNTAEISKAYDLIYQKYSVLFHRYGNTFTRKRLYEMDRHAAKFALENGEKKLYLSLKRKTFLRRPYFTICKALGLR